MIARRQRKTDRRRPAAAFRFQQPDSATVKAGIDPARFYAAELPAPVPTGNGWQVVRGLCPFHQDNRPGSFTCHTSSGAFKCHSCGAAGPDVIAFLMQRDGIGFRDALRYLERG